MTKHTYTMLLLLARAVVEAAEALYDFLETHIGPKVKEEQ